MIKWYFKVLKQYADFNGRSGRKEYWYFFLFNVIISTILTIIDVNFRLIIDRDMGLGLLSLLYALIVSIPSIAVGVRRLHDIGKSGKWLFIAFIPFIGGFWLLYLLALKGEQKDNNYGAVPTINM